MSICLSLATPSQGCEPESWQLQCPQPSLDKAFRLPTPEIQGGPGQQKRDASGERLQASGQDAVRTASQPCPATLLPRLLPRRGAAERKPGGAGGSTPTCLGERAFSQPLLLRWRRLDLRNAPHPHPRALSLLGVSTAASETRRRLSKLHCPSRLRTVAERPRLCAGSRAHLVLCKGRFDYCSGEVRSPPTVSERCRGGRS